VESRRAVVNGSRVEERILVSKKRSLTELEGCVLGLIWANGPCTPYAVRREFLGSPSPHWSGSAGTIYPLIRRLARLGLVRSRSHATGRRQGRHYVITPAGLRRLREWLSPHLSAQTVGVPPDPLRTRLRFLEALSSLERCAFLAVAERELQTQLARVTDDCARRAQDGGYAYLVALGARTALQARLDWIREVAAVHSRSDSQDTHG
jgi:DNA-binding PadR family transcriptional regulator